MENIQRILRAIRTLLLLRSLEKCCKSAFPGVHGCTAKISDYQSLLVKTKEVYFLCQGAESVFQCKKALPISIEKRPILQEKPNRLCVYQGELIQRF